MTNEIKTLFICVTEHLVILFGKEVVSVFYLDRLTEQVYRIFRSLCDLVGITELRGRPSLITAKPPLRQPANLWNGKYADFGGNQAELGFVSASPCDHGQHLCFFRLTFLSARWE